MAIKVDLHKRDGATTTAYKGFSWTTLFFGLFPALFRRDGYAAGLQFISALVTCGLSWLIWPFVYNGWHLKRLKAEGFIEDGHDVDLSQDEM